MGLFICASTIWRVNLVLLNGTFLAWNGAVGWPGGGAGRFLSASAAFWALGLSACWSLCLESSTRCLSGEAGRHHWQTTRTARLGFSTSPSTSDFALPALSPSLMSLWNGKKVFIENRAEIAVVREVARTGP